MKKGLLLLALCVFVLALAVLPAVNAGPVVVKYTRWASQQEAEDFQKLVDKFNAAQKKVRVETEFLPWGPYWQKVATTLVGGGAPDIISMSSGMSAQWMPRGVFYDLTKLSGVSGRLSQISKGALSAVQYEGKTYGMPVGIGVRALLYNKDLFDKAGIPYPDAKKPMTWNDLLALGKKFYKEDGKGNPTQFALNTDAGELWSILIEQAGGQVVDDYASPKKALFNSKEALEGLTFYARLFSEKVMPRTNTPGDWKTGDDAVLTGRVAMETAGPWDIQPAIDAKINFGLAPLWSGKKRMWIGYVNFLTVPKDCKHPKEAWQFISWVTSKAGQIEFTKTGDLPANTLALESCKKNPPRFTAEIMAPYYDAVKYIFTGVMAASGKWSAALSDDWQSLMFGTITPEEAARRMQEHGQKALDEIRADLRNM